MARDQDFNLYEAGLRLIALACGGAALGGMIAQTPGAISGIVLGGALGLRVVRNGN